MVSITVVYTLSHGQILNDSIVTDLYEVAILSTFTFQHHEVLIIVVALEFGVVTSFTRDMLFLTVRVLPTDT